MTTDRIDSAKTESTEIPHSVPAAGLSRRRLVSRIATVVFAATVLSTGGYLYYNSRRYESTDDAFIAGRIITVSPKVSGHVARVCVDDNQQVEAGELLLELYDADFKTELDAAAAKLASASATYESSKLGIDLTSTSSNSQYEQARANLAACEAEISIVQSAALAGINARDQEKAKLKAALADLEGARLDMEAAREQHERDLHDLQRSRKLVAAGAISKREFDHMQATEKISAAALASARKDMDSLRAQTELARAAVKAAENNLQQMQRQIEEKQAQAGESRARLQAASSAPTQIARSRSMAEVELAAVEEARARLRQARLNLSYTRIYAPVSGIVTSKGVEQGVYVQTGQSLLSIVPDDIWITANFKETQLENMHPGQPVSIRIDAYPDIKLNGRVDSIQRGTGAAFSLLPPNNATGNFVKVVQRVPVKIVFNDKHLKPDIFLGPGMSVIPQVDISSTASIAP